MTWEDREGTNRHSVSLNESSVDIWEPLWHPLKTELVSGREKFTRMDGTDLEEFTIGCLMADLHHVGTVAFWTPGLRTLICVGRETLYAYSFGIPDQTVLDAAIPNSSLVP